MKSICCMAWILGAMLLIATLDKIPDPPAAHRNNAGISASCPHEHSVAAVTPRAFINAPSHLPVRSVVADAVELLPHNHRIVLIERAADPSPPALQSQSTPRSKT
jgi:hypothetical protein